MDDIKVLIKSHEIATDGLEWITRATSLEEAILIAKETLELSNLENISLGNECAECLDPFPESKLTTCQACGENYCQDCGGFDDFGICAWCNEDETAVYPNNIIQLQRT